MFIWYTVEKGINKNFFVETASLFFKLHITIKKAGCFAGSGIGISILHNRTFPQHMKVSEV